MDPRLGVGEFSKLHALGNDYIVVDGARFGPLPPERVRSLCHRHFGIGSDGILVLVPSDTADLGLRIFNPDGSEAEKSGNGLRIFARCMFELGYVQAPEFTIATPGGVVRACLTLRDGTVTAIEVDMGRAIFDPIHPPGATLKVAGETLNVTTVSLGNPHCVCFTPVLDVAVLRRLGPLIENHPNFPQRTNVQFAQVVNRGRIDILIWERGAGETMASGSSSCAVAAAAFQARRVDAKVQVHMPGGVVDVDILPSFDLRLRGSATPIYRGRLWDIR